MFAVFAVRRDDGSIIHDPDQIRALLPPRTRRASPCVALGRPPITIAFGDRAALEGGVGLNTRVAAVEREDPWVKSALGISGLARGWCSIR
jgi:hypothetical protein